MVEPPEMMVPFMAMLNVPTVPAGRLPAWKLAPGIKLAAFALTRMLVGGVGVGVGGCATAWGGT